MSTPWKAPWKLQYLLVPQIIRHEPDLHITHGGAAEQVFIQHVRGECRHVVPGRVDPLEGSLEATRRVVGPALHYAVLEG